jgi:hypothetical protein
MARLTTLGAAVKREILRAASTEEYCVLASLNKPHQGAAQAHR